MAWVSDDDADLEAALGDVNLVLNRVRLAAFLSSFAQDRDVKDMLALDLLGAAMGLPLSSTGAAGVTEALTIRPFRIWEYLWLYKCLGLSAGGLKVLDLGGPASHLSILAAIAGCRVTSVDVNPEIVEAAKACACGFSLTSLDPRVGDMRDLSAFSDGEFDVVVSCSVLEHLTGEDQKVALREAARVLRPGGVVGLTFDFGIGAPGANEHLPPPHDPAATALEALERYVQGGLVQVGNPFREDPIPGCLFRHQSILYTVASLFLGKEPIPEVRRPRCESGGSVLRRLVIPDLPYRIQKEMRLAAKSEKDQEIAQLTAELNARESALGDMRSQLQSAGVSFREKDERAVALEHAAAERLAAMLEKDLLIARLTDGRKARESELGDMRGQLEGASVSLHEKDARAAALEHAAAERLAAMLEKDLLIARLTAELEARESALDDLRSKRTVTPQ